MLKDIIDSASSKMKKSLSNLSRSLLGIRTSKASSSLLEGIKIDVYGQQMLLKQAANVSARDTQTLMVQVWDQELVKTIERAIRDSDMGLGAATEGQSIRVTVPPFSEERRKEYVKLSKKFAEEARIAVRNIRREGMQSIDKANKNKMITQDEMRKAKKDLDSITQRIEKSIDEIISRKEKEIMEV